ncbi:hypothetical protein DPMN_140551 [Dreissena polymorpha]|uniref:Uncharacterized protein n=1 Tax=Dreissena polymorpha TaxID=45954 RepID=A0A9D4GB54_DREPO|nr:hypothetical protein DPMN_140551 [Dreissena polymorpha]
MSTVTAALESPYLFNKSAVVPHDEGYPVHHLIVGEGWGWLHRRAGIRWTHYINIALQGKQMSRD